MSDEKNVYEGIAAHLATIDVIAKEIADARKSAERLPLLEEHYRKLHADLVKQLDEMDITSRGNFGWEMRIVGFLRDFRRSISNDQR